MTVRPRSTSAFWPRLALLVILTWAPAEIAWGQARTSQTDIEQLQQEADQAMDRATTLFVVLLGTLILLLGLGVVMLWVLRRSVVSEVATVVRGQLNEMSDLEGKIRTHVRRRRRQ